MLFPLGWGVGVGVGSLLIGPSACSHINRRTQFENPVLEAKRRLQQQQMAPCPVLAALPLPNIYRGETPRVREERPFVFCFDLSYSESFRL